LTAALDRLVARIPRASWFAALGEALQPAEQTDLAAYIHGLGLPPCAPAAVADWARGRPRRQRPGLGPWLVGRGGAAARRTARPGPTPAHGARAAMDRLSAVAQAAHEATIGPAAMAAARAGVADQAMVRAAAGAATQACYQSGLALLAGATDPGHAFHAKLRLFLGGRWPLGILRGSAYMF
jgi:hypothetical protein